MKLYGSYTSPFVRHCRIVLLETGVDCEFIEADGLVSAAKSPTKKVPFFEDRDIFLSDSFAIVKYLREKAGQPFCQHVQDLDNLCLVNTLMDAAIILFMLEKDGITPEQSVYLKRSDARIESGLIELNRQLNTSGSQFSDVELRLGCFLAWVQYRKRFDFSHHTNLCALLEALNTYPPFTATHPPQP